MLIGQRKAAFEIKSAEIEEYLARNDEKEKNWLEKDDESSEKSESTAESGNGNGTQSAASGKLQKRTESGEIQQDKNKLTTLSGKWILLRPTRLQSSHPKNMIKIKSVEFEIFIVRNLKTKFQL